MRTAMKCAAAIAFATAIAACGHSEHTTVRRETVTTVPPPTVVERRTTVESAPVVERSTTVHSYQAE
jgi:hypothetical protein